MNEVRNVRCMYAIYRACMQILKAVKAIGKWTIFPNEFYDRNLILLIGLIEIENINYLSYRRDDNRVILIIFDKSICPFHQQFYFSNARNAKWRSSSRPWKFSITGIECLEVSSEWKPPDVHLISLFVRTKADCEKTRSGITSTGNKKNGTSAGKKSNTYLRNLRMPWHSIDLRILFFQFPREFRQGGFRKFLKHSVFISPAIPSALNWRSLSIFIVCASA